jgi:chaperonin GroEL
VLGPTIGPAGHPIAFSKIGRPGDSPELLLNGATIARRMIGIEQPFANMGLMLARQAAWTARSAGGDTPALAVAIMASALRTAARFAAAGANRIQLRRGMDAELARIVAELGDLARPATEAEIAGMAASLARDPDVADVVLRAATAVGPETPVVAMESRGRTIDLEVIEGSLWETTAVIGPMQAEGRDGYAWLDAPAVLIWDAPLTDPMVFAGCLDRIRRDGVQRLVVIARSFSKEILGLLALNTLPDFTVAPVEIPNEGANQVTTLEDIAALTTARILRLEANDRLAEVSVDDLGTAGRIVIGRRMLNIQADVGTAACQIRRAAVEKLLAETDDEAEERRLLTRLGRLRGGMAMIWVGAPTITQRADRMANLQRALNGVRQAKQSGYVPSLASASMALGCCSGGQSDLDLGAKAAREAMLAPARWLARNAGVPSTALELLGSGSEDAAGWDCAVPKAVLTEAIRIGLSAASLAISSDVLIHRPRSLSQADLRP